MRFPRWAVPVVLRVLSLAGLASAAGGGDNAQALAIGFALSTTQNDPTSLSQPLSLDLDFFVNVADLQLKVPIMPLHLLGKKSWNVYNTSNIEKVRRDESIALAAEEAEDQRLEDLDAARRLQILRGENPPPLAIEDTPPQEQSSRQLQKNDHKRPREREPERDGDGGSFGNREKKKRKKAGENDTDFEMRLAQSQALELNGGNKDRQLILRKESTAPITDHAGNISLFPINHGKDDKQVQKNPEAEKELARKKKEYEDQYTMRFSNAGGFKKDLGEARWYEKAKPNILGGEGEDDGEEGVVGKDVWGNEDPRRRERERKRVVDDDPLAFMKLGARKVREVERERKVWREEKEREIRELEILDRERERDRRNKKRRRDDDDELEGFRLDGDEMRDGERERRHRHKHSRRSEHSHSHSHRERDRERDKDRERDDEGRKHRHKHRRRSD